MITGLQASETNPISKLWNPEKEIRLAGSPKHGIPSIIQGGELPVHPPAYKIQQRNDLKHQGIIE